MTLSEKARYAILLGLSLCSGAALSAGNGDDSVHAWGRWDQMVAPAAGPAPVATPAQVLPQAALELRPEDSGAFSPGVQQVGGSEDPPGNGADPGPDFPVLVPGTGEQPPGGPIDRGPRAEPGPGIPVLIPGTDAGQPPGGPIDRGPRGGAS